MKGKNSNSKSNNHSSHLQSSAIERYIPAYGYHLSDNIISIGSNKLLCTLVIDGMPFESVSNSQIELAFLNFKDYLTSLGKEYGSSLGVWTHLIKKKVKLDMQYRFDQNQFAQSFADRYCQLFDNNNFFKTEYYISFIFKTSDIIEGIEFLNTIIEQSKAVLKNFSPKVLGRDGYKSEIAEFLSYLINNQSNDIPLSDMPICQQIPDSEWYFGYDLLEIRNKSTTDIKYATNYILKGFSFKTSMSQWDFLLALPYEFILTQSFIFASTTRIQKKIDQQINQLESSGESSDAIDELLIGKATLSEGKAMFGSYQSSLTIFGATEKEALDGGTKVSSEFLTSGGGFSLMKATIEGYQAFISSLPDSKFRPLDSRRTTTNLACLFSMHNYSFGKQYGNPIGDGTAIMPLKTIADGLYYFNTHYSHPHKNVTGKAIAGHFLLLGATGAGKTTLEGAIATFLQRFNPMMFGIDYNRSLEMTFRGLGGEYFAIKEGEFTGFNPFQLEEKASDNLRSFLYRWVESCAKDTDGNVSDEDAEAIRKAVNAILEMPLPLRRFGLILSSINKGTSLRLRLSKYCESEGGKLAWVVDSPINTFNPINYQKVGFDTTVVLEKDSSGNDHPACETLLAVLLFYKQVMQQHNPGRLMLSLIEEFWKPANYPTTQELIKSILKAGRIKNEFIGLVSQSPADAIKCDIFEAIVEQTPTKIFLPNPDAEYKNSYEKIGLTVKEFERLRRLDLASRTFLIKQSNSSCFAKMDLEGFDEYLPIISGTHKGIELCEKIRKELGTNEPSIWMPIFIKELLQKE